MRLEKEREHAWWIVGCFAFWIAVFWIWIW